ncbi:MAG: zinc ribbon domain-containing protein [Acidobacteria bacterium]|nr:zinc ribbon domain-containing protein [Acidobacteriota bacterium]
MPLYEYQCDACSRRFEVIQKYSDPHPETCPTCGGSVKRLISSPAIQFKGSGWYITDYARAGKSDDGGSSGKSDSAAKTSGEGEAKPSDTKTSEAKATDSKGTASKSDAGSPPAAKSSE